MAGLSDIATRSPDTDGGDWRSVSYRRQRLPRAVSVRDESMVRCPGCKAAVPNATLNVHILHRCPASSFTCRWCLKILWSSRDFVNHSKWCGGAPRSSRGSSARMDSLSDAGSEIGEYSVPLLRSGPMSATASLSATASGAVLPHYLSVDGEQGLQLINKNHTPLGDGTENSVLHTPRPSLDGESSSTDDDFYDDQSKKRKKSIANNDPSDEDDEDDFDQQVMSSTFTAKALAILGLVEAKTGIEENNLQSDYPGFMGTSDMAMPEGECREMLSPAADEDKDYEYSSALVLDNHSLTIKTSSFAEEAENTSMSNRSPIVPTMAANGVGKDPHDWSYGTSASTTDRYDSPQASLSGSRRADVLMHIDCENDNIAGHEIASGSHSDDSGINALYASSTRRFSDAEEESVVNIPVKDVPEQNHHQQLLYSPGSNADLDLSQALNAKRIMKRKKQRSSVAFGVLPPPQMDQEECDQDEKKHSHAVSWGQISYGSEQDVEKSVSAGSSGSGAKTRGCLKRNSIVQTPPARPDPSPVAPQPSFSIKSTVPVMSSGNINDGQTKQTETPPAWAENLYSSLLTLLQQQQQQMKNQQETIQQLHAQQQFMQEHIASLNASPAGSRSVSAAVSSGQPAAVGSSPSHLLAPLLDDRNPAVKELHFSREQTCSEEKNQHQQQSLSTPPATLLPDTSYDQQVQMLSDLMKGASISMSHQLHSRETAEEATFAASIIQRAVRQSLRRQRAKRAGTKPTAQPPAILLPSASSSSEPQLTLWKSHEDEEDEIVSLHLSPTVSPRTEDDPSSLLLSHQDSRRDSMIQNAVDKDGAALISPQPTAARSNQPTASVPRVVEQQKRNDISKTDMCDDTISASVAQKETSDIAASALENKQQLKVQIVLSPSVSHERPPQVDSVQRRGRSGSRASSNDSRRSRSGSRGTSRDGRKKGYCSDDSLDDLVQSKIRNARQQPQEDSFYSDRDIEDVVIEREHKRTLEKKPNEKESLKAVIALPGNEDTNKKVLLQQKSNDLLTIETSDAQMPAFEHAKIINTQSTNTRLNDATGTAAQDQNAGDRNDDDDDDSDSECVNKSEINFSLTRAALDPALFNRNTGQFTNLLGDLSQGLAKGGK